MLRVSCQAYEKQLVKMILWSWKEIWFWKLNLFVSYCNVLCLLRWIVICASRGVQNDVTIHPICQGRFEISAQSKLFMYLLRFTFYGKHYLWHFEDSKSVLYLWHRTMVWGSSLRKLILLYLYNPLIRFNDNYFNWCMASWDPNNSQLTV